MSLYGINYDFEPVTYSDRLGWKLKSNYQAIWENLSYKVHYQTNSRGFRDREHEIQKKSSTRRIMVLGDSFAEGWGMAEEKMWQFQLEKMFEGKVEVMNYGVRGYDVLQEYKQLLEMGLQYRPDLVIQLLCENDYEKKYWRDLIAGDKKRFRPQYEIRGEEVFFLGVPEFESSTVQNHGYVRTFKRIFFQSAFLSWLHYKLINLPSASFFLIKSGLRKKESIADHSTPNYYETHYLKAVELVYAHLAILSKQHRFRLIVVWMGPRNMPTGLKTILEKNGHHALDFELTRERNFKYDVHANRKGNDELAAEIFKSIRERKLIPNESLEPEQISQTSVNTP